MNMHNIYKWSQIGRIGRTQENTYFLQIFEFLGEVGQGQGTVAKILWPMGLEVPVEHNQNFGTSP